MMATDWEARLDRARENLLRLRLGTLPADLWPAMAAELRVLARAIDEGHLVAVAQQRLFGGDAA